MGWTSSEEGGNSLTPWQTADVFAESPPHSAFAPDPAIVSDNRLDSPIVTLASGQNRLSFRNNFITESNYDGGVLEISIAGGEFIDIVDAGGTFVSGGYIDVLEDGAGRDAWAGDSGGFIDTVVNLPAQAAGEEIQLRWRMLSDGSISGIGWYIDDVVINSSSAPANLTVWGDNLYFTAEDGVNGRELWQFDGTEATRVTDINPEIGDSNPQELTVFNDALMFSATDGTSGRELWRLDVMEATRVTDLNPDAGDTAPSGFTVFNDTLIFSADDGTGRRLWRYEGLDPAEPVPAPTDRGQLFEWIVFGDELVFSFVDGGRVKICGGMTARTPPRRFLGRVG